MNRRALLAALAAPALAGTLGACRGRSHAGRDDPAFDPKAMTPGLTALAERARPGILGVAAQDLTTAQRIAVAGDRPFPMDGVWRAALGAAALAEIETGALAASETLTIEDVDLSPPPGATADAWPEHDRYTVDELLKR
ncbi:MAG: serine hydrolase, partial [Caulobacter sp.]